jgi:hypothetical protein
VQERSHSLSRRKNGLGLRRGTGNTNTMNPQLPMLPAQEKLFVVKNKADLEKEE